MRGILRWAAGVILVLAVVWGGLWWYAQGRLQDMLATSAKLHDTSDGSSAVSYDNITKGTTPLAASATIHNVRWSLQTPGTDTPVVIGMAQVKVWIDAVNPLVMHIGLPDRIVVITPKATGNITFGAIAISAGLDPRTVFNRKIYPLTSQTVAIRDANVLIAGGFPVLHIDAISGHETFNAGAGAKQTALSAVDRADGISLPPGIVALAHVPFGGKIAHIGFTMTLTGPADWQGLMDQLRAPQLSEPDRRKILIETAHGWAAHGGSGQAGLTVALGPTTLKAKGAVTFDAAAQPSGTADVTADHLDAFTAALTNAYPRLQQGIATVETQLSPYLATTSASGQALAVHVVYGKPGVMVNGSRKADMPPLDWTALENPPAQPALPPQAPGDGSGAALPSP